MTKSHLYDSIMKKSKRRGSMTGFALWDVLLLVALIASILLAIFLIQQSRTELRTVEQRNAKLLWADQLVAGFASSNLRLPCPDTNNDGNEDCGTGAVSGRLPLLSLGLKADAAVRGPQEIFYSVTRPDAARDIAQLSSLFEPEEWDGTRYAYGTSNGLDFCQKLVNNTTAVAYSVSVKQDDGEADLVKQRSAAELANSMSCMTTMMSVNGIALAVDVVNEVLDEQDSIKESAIIMIAFNVLHIVLAGIDVVLAAINLATSIAMLSTASGLLSAAIASCIVLVGCALIPVYTAAVVASVIAITLSGVAIAAGAFGIAALVYSTALAIEVAIATGNSPGDQTLDVDLADQLQTVIDLESQATQDEAEAAAQAVRLQQTLTARNNALTNINNILSSTSNANATEVNAAVAASVAYNNARVAQNLAQGTFDDAVKKLNDMNTAVTNAITNCANADLSGTPPKEKYKCDAVPRVQARQATAQAEYNTAQANLTAANNQVTATKTAYETARDTVLGLTNAYGTASIYIPIFNFTIINNRFDEYRDAYYNWQRASSSYTILAQKALDTRAAATQARADYNQLLYNSQNPGSVPTGSAVVVWAGAEAILEQSDANGEVE
jgi:hypothetical protein